VGVWSVTTVGFLLLWFAIRLFDLECEPPCDGSALAVLGFLELGIVVLVVANLPGWWELDFAGSPTLS
jgi:hypothetical protein